MSGLPELRAAIETTVDAWLPADRPVHRHDIKRVADHLLAEIIPDPQYAAAILNLIGDVEEAWACQRTNNAPICPGEHQCTCENPDPQPVIVVRPRGEATEDGRPLDRFSKHGPGCACTPCVRAYGEATESVMPARSRPISQGPLGDALNGGDTEARGEATDA